MDRLIQNRMKTRKEKKKKNCFFRLLFVRRQTPWNASRTHRLFHFFCSSLIPKGSTQFSKINIKHKVTAVELKIESFIFTHASSSSSSSLSRDDVLEKFTGGVLVGCCCGWIVINRLSLFQLASFKIFLFFFLMKREREREGFVRCVLRAGLFFSLNFHTPSLGFHHPLPSRRESRLDCSSSQTKHTKKHVRLTVSCCCDIYGPFINTFTWVYHEIIIKEKNIVENHVCPFCAQKATLLCNCCPALQHR